MFVRRTTNSFPISWAAACNSSIIFEANSLTLIEGKSGTGKSTLLNVLSGVTETSSGKLVFSIPPNDTLRIGYMDQQSVVFEGTLAENIALIENFNETDLELINKAVDNVGLSEFRDKTGLNNFILGRDIIPSGGELQKISLARLFFADFNVLLLDEPTSNLDRISEIKIIDSLKTAAKSKTIILVSHSLAIQDSIKCKLLMNGNSHE
jgi:ABC-type transport system involved in cytochrome bd biosynthesis fused ATPase/permease subunit